MVKYRNIILVCLALISSLIMSAQQTTIASGIVRDSVSGEPLSYVSVIFKNTTIGAMTGDDGSFSLKNDKGNQTLVVSSLGYNTKEVVLKSKGNNAQLDIPISPVSFKISEVVIKPKKEKYSKKNNPAVELIKKVIAHKKDNRIESREEYKTECYEKLVLSLDNFNPNLEKGLWKKFNFIKNYLDTSAFNGKPILTVSVREKLSDVYYNKEENKKRVITKATRLQGIDKSLDEGGISANLEEIFQPIDIFDNDIKILLNRFPSPLSSTIATSYYKYYILDTLDISGEKCIDLAFAPHNSESYGFTGRLYITTDGTYSLKKFTINTPYKINLNFVDKMRIDQEFVRAADSTWILKDENTFANFYIVKGSQQFYAHQTRHYEKYKFDSLQADSVFNLLGERHILSNADVRKDEYWEANRPIPLQGKENALDDLLNELRQVDAFNVIIKTAEILISGYIKTAADEKTSKFDFGPMNTTFSGNQVEGFRMRIGGMTTANLNPHLFASGYLAYGISDRKVKYNTQLTYSFNKKKYHPGENPVNNLSFTHEYDLYTPGQNFLFTSKDNMFVAIKVGEPVTKMTYIRKSLLQYEREWLNGLSFKTWLNNENNEAAGTLQYVYRDDLGHLSRVKSLTTNEIGAQIRFAPGERPYNGRAGKSSIFNMSKDAPIFTISHQMGFDVLGGQFNYHHTEIGAEKRIWLSAFGHIDANINAGKVWSKVPFPLLIMPNTNQSITIQPGAFHMMNALEFVADEYVSMSATYYLKGWILNRIPYLNWFKLREVVSFSGIMGNLSDKNNPTLGTKGLYLLPDGTRPIGSKPYLEASVGLENIFKILRIDYFRRLTYLNQPNIKKDGIRIALRFSF